jgi:NAD kinase
MKSQQPRIVVVTRETRMEGLLQRWGTRGQARFALKLANVRFQRQQGDLDAAVAAEMSDEVQAFDDLDEEDDAYRDTVGFLKRELDFGIPVQVVDRRYVPTIDFGLCAAVVVVGQDGLVANTAKYVGTVPIVGVNPDPGRFDGVLLPFAVRQARGAVSRVLKGQARTRNVVLARAVLHDGQSLLAFNDLFVGARSHVSARYELEVRGARESQSSSGILVATGAGSTGWLSSVFNMTRGIARLLGAPLPAPSVAPRTWEDESLFWVVREPFASRSSAADLVAGSLAAGDELVVESRMPAGGVIFSDGVETDFLEFNGGAIARIGLADHRARLVVP